MTDDKKKPEGYLPRDLSFDDLDAFLESAPSDSESTEKGRSSKLELKKWLFEKRLDYARHFFDHHAKQRMQMFNFFLIFVGFFIAGYATILKDGYSRISAALAFVGAGLTVLFIFLDRRNEELVHITEDVLGSLESDVLFSGYERSILWPRHRAFWGTMKRGHERRPLGIFLRQQLDDQCGPVGQSKYEHGRWIPVFQCCIVLMFLFLAILSWMH